MRRVLGGLAKRSQLSLLCLQFMVWYKYVLAPGILQVKAMLFNSADADLFNSHVSYGNNGIYHKQNSEQDELASLLHQTMFITLIIL